MTRVSEDGLIARYFAPLAGPGGLGLVDDAALLTPTAGQDLVLTVDAIVEGIHFLAGDPPETLGVKALGVNLSDLAAKGAEPVGFLLTLALPAEWNEDWLRSFADGLGRAASDSGCFLLGGDTVRAAGALSLSVTAIGQVPAGGMIRRTTARPGDRLVVSGTIGDAVLGLALLTSDPPWATPLDEPGRAFAIDRYRRPQPRLALARPLLRNASAAMDVSDGLVGDLSKMMRASGTGARIDLNAVPLSAAAALAVAVDPALYDRLVTGGDDYEILASVPETSLADFLAEARSTGIPVAVIGKVVDGPTVFLHHGVERQFEHGSFSHF